MAFAGLKKQFNKANQFISEKTGVAEGTKFTDEYTEMEKRTDTTSELVDELLNRTKEYLQPNPASRAKLMMTSTLGGKTRAHAYPQPEGTLGEIMVRYGQRMGDQSSQFSRSLIEMGEAMREMAEVKYALEDNVKQNFLEPLHHLQAKDLKDVNFHRRKLEGRRLDYDCKSRKKKSGGHVTEEDMHAAGIKFEESFNSAAQGMHNLLQNDVEQISQLAALSEALYEYYSQSANILESLTSRLIEMKNEAAQQEHEPFVPKRIHELIVESNDLISPATDHFPSASPLPSPVRSPAPSPVSRGPCCQALYDFDAENAAELPFKEGNVISLVNKIDDNWFEGSFNGKRGIFPVAYVQVLVPLEKK